VGTNTALLKVERRVMGLVLLLLVLALLFGGLGLFVEGLKWVLIIALALLVVGAFTGYRGRARA
jgi:CHASE2 domain-containing sensor protein